MPDIKSVVIVLRQPSGKKGDTGLCDIGSYYVQGDTIVMVDDDGSPLR